MLSKRLRKLEAKVEDLIPREEAERFIEELTKTMEAIIIDAEERERFTVALQALAEVQVKDLISHEEVEWFIKKVVDLIDRTITDPKDRARFLAAMKAKCKTETVTPD